MSQIDKLGILGIRSFSHEEPQYIKFLSPFTLIVGANGTGKTTIIECLKYACTGDQPPNSKGGAFIHDTKIAGVKEVKAQIRLKFIDIDGQRILCSRSMSLTQTKTKTTQKTLDSSLQRYNPVSGETFSISSRCADMDALLPIHLGVPKAILENVIFCHQEESNWPLSEPSVLKKKFDDIFASTKYTKALDSIKDIRKERAQDARTDQVRLEGLKNDTLKAQRLQSDVNNMEKECQDKQSKIEHLDQQIHNTSIEIERLLEVHQQSQTLTNKISQIKQQRDLYIANLQELEKDLTERSETDEELSSLLQAQSNKTTSSEDARNKLESERNRLEKQLQMARDKVSSKLTEIGRLQAESDIHGQCMEERSRLIRDIYHEFNLDYTSQTDSLEATKIIRQTISKMDKELQQLNTQGQTEQNTLSDELQTLKSERYGLDQAKKHTQHELDKDNDIIRSLTNQLETMRATHVDFDVEKDRLVKEEDRLASHKAYMSNRNTDSLLSSKERQLRDLDDQITNLNDEMSKLSLQGDTHARLALKQTDRDAKLAAARSIFEQCKDEVVQRMETEPTLERLDQDLKSLLEKQILEISAIQNRCDQANRDLSSVETLYSITRNSIKDKKTEIDSLKTAIDAVCPDTSLPDELKKVEDDIMDLRSKISSLGAAELLYSRFVKKAETNHHCPLCTRQFAQDNELARFIEKLQTTVDRIPNQQTDYSQRVQELEQKQQHIRSLESSWIRMDTLRNKDLAELEKTALEQEKKQDEATNKMVKLQAEMVQALEDRKKLERIFKLSEDAVRQYRESKQLDKDISRLEADIRDTGSTRTITDCQRELEDLADQSKTVRKEIKRLHDDREISMKTLQRLENNVRDARDSLTQLQHRMDAKTSIEERLSAARRSLNTNKTIMKDYDSRKNILDTKIDDTTASFEKCRDEWKTKYDHAHRSVNQGKQRMDLLDTLTIKIERYNNSNNASRLKDLTNEKIQLDKRIQVLTEDLEGKDAQVRVMDKEMADQQGIERQLKDHLRYRSIKRQLETCIKELEEYQRQSQQFRKATYEQKLDLLKDKQSQYISTRGGLQGEIRQMRDQLQRYQHDLDTDYLHVQERYNKQFVQVKTNEIAVNDLEKYTKALQQAIMRYHSLKMEDLNKIIKELWMSTYRGGDIDYIEIRSDAEGTTAANRSYNYRVVMVKDGKEMNIRGRCSAGQKVLTSIIIRLALAETFCIHCGVLALDEPTTNLDRANIESLADNLAKIIQSRKAQSNFQLIVITHDEDFVEYLSRAEVAENYYRISKDENQCSIIRQESFADA